MSCGVSALAANRVGVVSGVVALGGVVTALAFAWTNSISHEPSFRQGTEGVLFVIASALPVLGIPTFIAGMARNLVAAESLRLPIDLDIQGLQTVAYSLGLRAGSYVTARIMGLSRTSRENATEVVPLVPWQGDQA